VQVPGELSLVGFDNSVFARLRALWLTSVDGTAYSMGQQAARTLLARIEHPDAPAAPSCCHRAWKSADPAARFAADPTARRHF